MRILMCILILLIFKIGFSQQINYSKFQGEKFSFSINDKLNKPYFREYGSPNLEYVKIYNSNSSKLRGTPEEILNKIYSSRNVEDLNKQFKPSSRVNYTNYKTQLNVSDDTLRNFLLLRHKLTFNIDDRSELILIKYTQYVDSIATKDFVVQVNGENNNWKAVQFEDYNDLTFIMINVSAAEFWSLVKKSKLDTNDKFIKQEILDKVKNEDGILNLTKLVLLLKEIKRNGKQGLND